MKFLHILVRSGPSDSCKPGCVASDAGWPAATALECLVCLAAGVTKTVQACYVLH